MILKNHKIKQIIYKGIQSHEGDIPLHARSLLYDLAGSLDENGQSDLLFIMVKIISECWFFSAPVIADLFATLPPDHHVELDTSTASNAAYILKETLECKDLKEFSSPDHPRKIIPFGRPNA